VRERKKRKQPPERRREIERKTADVVETRQRKKETKNE